MTKPTKADREAAVIVPVDIPFDMSLKDVLLLHSRVVPSGCWLWTRATDGHGYGIIYSVKHKRRFSAHRTSHTIFIGPIPEGLFVCHRCDVPKCVNPAHLFAATHRENMLDAYRKGRGSLQQPGIRPYGERTSTAKLTEDDVIRLRKLAKKGGRSQRRLAREFGVSPAVVWQVIHRRSWKHIPAAAEQLDKEEGT